LSKVDEAGVRVAARLGGEYVLRSLRMLGELSSGQMLTGLISLAIVQANVAHLDGRDRAEPYRHLDDLPPDDQRRPVTVLSIATGLGLPYETTRRHVEKMVKAGQVVRVKGGVITPVSALDTPLHRKLLVEHLVSVRRLVRGLAAAGVEMD
jgi:hypothetical protein